MKNGTAYAARLKRAFAKQKLLVTTVELPESDDPIRRLAIGVLGVANGDEFSERLVNKLTANVVSWNEVRVSNSRELQRAAGDSVDSHAPYYERLIRALQSVFDHENVMSLDRLKSMGRREAKGSLEELDAVDEYAVASILLWSLGGHAIPVCDRLLDSLRAANLVHPDATRAEVQAFLERHVPAAEAKTFCVSMRTFSPPKRVTAKTTGAAEPQTAKKGTTTTRKRSGSSTTKKSHTK